MKKTPTELKSDSAALFVTNTTQAITAALVKAFMDDLLDSIAGLDDVSADIETGSVNLNDTVNGLMVDSKKVVGAQEANIAALDGGATLGDVITKVNAVLTALKNHGLVEADT
jgi:hypothetical protein